jgi:hypothetical protein
MAAKGPFRALFGPGDEGDERKIVADRRPRSSHPKQLDAGPFEAEVGSFWLHLAAEGKAGRTLDAYTKAVRWFAAAHLVQQTDKTRWEQVDRQDLQRWTVRLLGDYSAATRATNSARSACFCGGWPSRRTAGSRRPGAPDANGIYQAVARAGERVGVAVYPHRFRHHFSHTWLDRGGAEGDLMELNGWFSPQMLTRYGASARGARARRSYDRVMTDNTP